MANTILVLLVALATLVTGRAANAADTESALVATGADPAKVSAAIVLPAEAHVKGTELALGALATIDCADAELRARLERYSLGWAPAPGYSRLLQRAVLQRDLTAAFPGAVLTIAGADACRVHPKTRIVRGAELEAKGRAELDALFVGRDAVVRIANASADLEVPDARETMELRARLERRELRGGTWSVPVQVWIDGALYQTAWTTFATELWTELPVLVRDVARCELLSSAHVEPRRVKVEDGASFAALGADALAGAVAQRDLARGSVVTDRDVKRAQLVARGEPVTLEVRKGAVTARSTGTCNQDGALGDVVKVLTADKSREIVARVAGRGLVVVQL